MGNTQRNVAIGALAGAGLITALSMRSAKSRRYMLDGKVALVTGGSRGLGLVLARELASRGCTVAICARDAEELGRARDDIRQISPKVAAFACDVRDKGDVQRLVADVNQLLGDIDILINDAGVISVGPVDLQTEDDFKEMMDIHFWASLHTMKAVLPQMKRRGSGRIANIASIGGKIAVPHLAAYCASKFALVGLSTAMRAELVKNGIYVTTVCPGLMRTGSHINAEFKGQREKEFTLFSLMDGSYFTSVSAEHAAKSIVRAVERGDAELVISPQAKMAAKFYGAFPEVTADILAMVDRVLPGPSGHTTAAKGLESQSALSPSILTANIDAASERNNELKPGQDIH